MEKIAWLGGPFIHRAMRKQGFTVEHHPLEKVTVLDWAGVVDLCETPPDILVLGDQSRPPVLIGVESFPCLTAFYCVDTHIHGWQPFYAQAFDLVTVNLLDHLDSFKNKYLPDERIIWSPPYARDDDLPQEAEKEWDLLFAGTVDPVLTPKRYAFLNELKARFPGLAVEKGEFRKLFARARLVLNFVEQGDLNFRVFEALGCKSCLLTPRVGHGQDKIFTDRRDFFLYDPQDMDGLLKLVHGLLADPALCAQAAQNGFDRVNAAHRAWHRAGNLAQKIRGLDRDAVIRSRLENKDRIRRDCLKLLYLHFAETLPDPALRKAYLMAASG